MSESKKLSVIVKLTIKAGERADVAKVFEEVRPLVDDEAGTIQYSIHLDQGDENVLWIVEVYEDQDAMNAHMGGAALAKLGEVLATKVEGRPEMHLAAPIPSKGI